MLYDVGPTVFESEKERNLYYKVLAGYVFNELVPGWSERLAAFNELLQRKVDAHQMVLKRRVELTEATHVSFDNHAYVVGYDTDRGELADILLHDASRKLLVAIEAKFSSDWSVAKDIHKNLERLDLFRQRWLQSDIVPCLLVTQRKWDAVQGLRKHRNSSYRRYVEQFRTQVLVLTWEELLPLCREAAVRKYLEYQLALTNHRFRLVEDGFERVGPG